MHDAAFAIVLHRYIISRALHGETVTDITAARILEIALTVGMEPAHDLGLMGFRLGPNNEVHPLLPHRLQTALATVRRDGVNWVAHLAQHVDGRSTKELMCGDVAPAATAMVRPRKRDR